MQIDQFDSFVFVLCRETVTVYLNGERRETASSTPQKHPETGEILPCTEISITHDNPSTIHIGRVKEDYDLPLLLKDIPEEVWVQPLELMDLIMPNEVRSESKTFPSDRPRQ